MSQKHLPVIKNHAELHRVAREVLQLYQPVRRFGQNGERGKLAAHHSNFVAPVKSGTDVAILVNLVGKVLPLRHHESLACKKFWGPREEADAIHAMPFRLGH